MLLIVLHNRQGERTDRVKLEDLIFSEKYGKKSFNIDVPERTLCMEALFMENSFDGSDESESVQNIEARYDDLAEMFPEEIDEQALPYFADWLIENVHLVEITAFSDQDAYTIFETMNDRGLSLSPLDMLKGYLLASIPDAERRSAAARVWRERYQWLVCVAECGSSGRSQCLWWRRCFDAHQRHPPWYVRALHAAIRACTGRDVWNAPCAK